MAWTRVAVALLIVFSLTATPSARSPSPPVLDTGTLRFVNASGVQAHLPPKWDFRPLPRSPAHRNGIQASNDLAGWSPSDLRRPGLEAYWVDATEVGVTSDYYELAARGPVMDLLESAPGCESETRQVSTGERDPTDAVHPGPAQYVATVTGSCTSKNQATKWASFVAAPGYGPVHQLGIPRSGLYVVTASVREGPTASERLNQLMNGVAFGGTPVPDLLLAAGLPEKLL